MIEVSRYSARVKRERDKTEKDLDELREEFRESGERASQQITSLQSELDAKKQKVSELEHALADLKRFKNRQLFARDRETQKRTARWLQSKFQTEVERILDESAGIVDPEVFSVGGGKCSWG